MANEKTISVELNQSELHDILLMYKDVADKYYDLKLKPNDFSGYQKFRDAYTEIQRL